MNRNIRTGLVFMLVLSLLAGCSTKKNTWLTRNFHSMTTKYNIAFNGNESYEEGLKSMLAGNTDDYSTVIPLYPISHHENASAASSNMDRAIEKGRKAIKLHSIKAKPKRDAKKWNDPVYQSFYNQSEFNPALKDAWMLVGKAEFHKADFLGSIGTFSYISRYYSEDKDLVAQCQLWMVRAYAEMDWIYEAEQMLGKVNQDDLKTANVGLFAAANAVLLLKQDLYREAIPFVEMLASRERNKGMKQRFTFVLAQLYQLTGNKNAAIDSYSAVLKMNPPYVMDFNARINRAQLLAGSGLGKVVKELTKMAKNSNNKEYLDQIYYAIGNAYLNNGDTAKAIENYRLSAEKSTRNGVEKAVTLITMGDLFYGRRDYMQAQPAYSEASGIITVEHDDYARVSKLAEVLGELVVPYEVVVLQDSLQHLSTLSKEEQLEVIQKVIEYKIEQERLAQEKAEEQARLAEEENERFVPVGGPVGSEAGKWYFYNPNLVRTGKAEFQKRWGNRKLEDNWRRSNKSAALFGDDGMGDGMDMANATDSIAGGDSIQSGLADDKNPEFYLKQIPSTPEQIALSNQQIADALLSMGAIYKDKLNDLPMAVETYEEFIRRFGTDGRVPDAYFQLYLVETKRENKSAADGYRATIVRDFPDTKYAQILSHPDYIARFNLMQKQQDSLYSATYAAYSSNRFQEVIDNVYHARVNYPLSELMPKFLFLEALTIGKTDTPENFEKALNELVENYPQSDVSAMAKDIAAMIRQGREAQTGTSHGTLLTRRDDELKAAMEEAGVAEAAGRTFSAEKQGKHRVLLIGEAEAKDMYGLMYQVAAYNFTRFMIKEFDLVLNPLDDTRQMLSVTNFESYDEAKWYLGSVNKDLTLGSMFRQLGIHEVIISEDNFALLRVLGLDEYLLFQKQHLGDSSVQLEVEKAAVRQETVVETEEKPVETAVVQPQQVPDTTRMEEPETPVEAESVESSVATETEQPVAEVQETENAKETTEPELPAEEEHPVVQELAEEENLDLYEGLFAYQPDKPHFVAVYVLSGTIDFERFKTDVDAYNASNYAMLNLDVSMETVDGRQVVIIGSFGDANVAKSYLLRMVKEKNLFEGLKGSNYRNLFGTQRNLNVLMQRDALSTYTKFMQEFYLK